MKKLFLFPFQIFELYINLSFDDEISNSNTFY